MERKDLKDYQHLHAEKIYGTGGRSFPHVLPHILALRPQSLVDYGAGRSEIALWLGRSARIPRVVRFDPAVPGIDELPAGPFDVVTSFDVLEHIPEDELDGVLAEMAALGRHALHVIHTAPAKTILADGRNAHVTLHDEPWWHQCLARHFPAIRPFKIQRQHRVAFKTWEQQLPPWRCKLVRFQAKLARKLRRRG